MKTLVLEQRQFIIDNCKKMDNIDLARAINEKWGTNFTNTDIGYKKKYIKKKFGINTDCPKELNKSFLKKGNIPFNKGLTWDDYMSDESQERARKLMRITHGNRGVYNSQPIGTESLKIKETGRAYWYIKTGKDKWEAKHRLLWEKTYGAIPKDKMLLFLDGDTNNVCLENLILVSRQEGIYLNRHNLISKEPEITRAGIKLAKIEKIVNERAKEITKHGKGNRT